MKSKELLYEIGEISDKFICVGAPVMKRQTKYRFLRWLAVAACLCLVLAGLGLWRIERVNPTIPPVVDIPEHNATGGDEHNATGGEGNFDYERAYAPKLYQLDSDLMNYIVESGGTDLYEWLEQVTEETKKSKYNISDPKLVPALLRTIEKYNIPKAEFERLNNDRIDAYKEMGDDIRIEQICYTQEEVDALYSKNTATITRTFATKYAIVVGDKAYAPNFYLHASEKELQACAITASAIKEKTELLYADGVMDGVAE